MKISFKWLTFFIIIFENNKIILTILQSLPNILLKNYILNLMNKDKIIIYTKILGKDEISLSYGIKFICSRNKTQYKRKKENK